CDLARLEVRELPVARLRPLPASPAVDRAALGHGGEPRARIARHPALAPLPERRHQGLTRTVLGRRHVPGHPGQRGDHRGPLDPPDGVEAGGEIVHRGPSVEGCGSGVPSSSRQPFSFWMYSLSANSSKSDSSVTRRTSRTTPGPIGARRAHSAASSFDETSRIQNPLNSSWISPYGPSVMTGSSPS